MEQAINPNVIIANKTIDFDKEVIVSYINYELQDKFIGSNSVVVLLEPLLEKVQNKVTNYDKFKHIFNIQKIIQFIEDTYSLEGWIVETKNDLSRNEQGIYFTFSYKI